MRRRNLFRMIAAALLLNGCLDAFERDEVARTASVDGKVDAVLFETNGGATTSFGYEVYVVVHGAAVREDDKVAFFYGVTRSKTAYGVNLRWIGLDELRIEYLSAQKVEILAPSRVVDGRIVAVRIQGDTSDPAAPSGGMLYNLQGRPDG